MNRPACLSVGLSPRFINKRAASAYCGIQLNKFDKICDVEPIKFSNDAREHRYDIKRLDEWCDRQSGMTRSIDDYLAGLDDEQEKEIRCEG